MTVRCARSPPVVDAPRAGCGVEGGRWCVFGYGRWWCACRAMKRRGTGRRRRRHRRGRQSSGTTLPLSMVARPSERAENVHSRPLARRKVFSLVPAVGGAACNGVRVSLAGCTNVRLEFFRGCASRNRRCCGCTVRRTSAKRSGGHGSVVSALARWARDCTEVALLPATWRSGSICVSV